MDYTQKRELILKGDMRKVIFTLSLPIMLNNFIHTIYNITDTYFVSKIGDDAVAGVQFVWPLIFLTMAFGIGMSVASSALIAQYIGAHRHDKAKKTAGQVITLLMLIAGVFGVIGFFSAPHVVRLMGATGTLLDSGVAYLEIMFLGLPATFLMNAFNAIKQGQGDTVSPLKIGGASVVVNMILDPIFIFVLDLGIEGAAMATILSTGVFALYGILKSFDEKQSLMLEFKDLKPNWPVMGEIVRIGLPSSAGQATTAFGFTVLNVFLVDLGKVTLTAFAIGNRISSLIMMPAMGIGSALATVVGQNLGAENVPRAKKAVRESVLLSTVILLIGGLVLYPFTDTIVKGFSKNPEIIASGTEYLKILFLTVPLMGYFQILIGVFQGSGHTFSAMLIMMGRLWGLRIPMVMFFSRQASFGPSSIWYAMIFSNLIICLIGLGIYMTGRWQTKVIKPKKVVVARS